MGACRAALRCRAGLCPVRSFVRMAGSRPGPQLPVRQAQAREGWALQSVKIRSVGDSSAPTALPPAASPPAAARAVAASSTAEGEGAALVRLTESCRALYDAEHSLLALAKRTARAERLGG